MEYKDLLAKAGVSSFDTVFRVVKEIRLLKMPDDDDVLCEGSAWFGPEASLYVIPTGIYGAWGLDADKDSCLVGCRSEGRDPSPRIFMIGLDLVEIEALNKLGYLRLILEDLE